MIKRMMQNRRFRRGSVATGITVVVVAVVVTLNLIVGRLDARYGLSVDLTAGKVYTLSEDTAQYIRALEKDVSVYVLNDEQTYAAGGEYLRQAAEILRQYELLSPRVTVRFVDIMRDASFVNRHTELELAVDDVLVVCGDEKRIVMPQDLFNYQSDEYGTYITSSKAEQSITGAIIAVTSDEQRQVALLTGHSEAPLTGLAELLALNNYTCLEVSLASQDIPADTAIAILSAPLADYGEAELIKLDRFLEQGGHTLFYLAAIDQPALPALEAFLAEWGIGVGTGSVFENDAFMRTGNSPFFTSVFYDEDDYSKPVLRSGMYVSMPNSRPLELLETPGASVISLLSFSTSAALRPADAEDWDLDDATEYGPFPALLLSQRQVDGGAASVLVASTSLAVEGSILQMPTFANSRYYLSLLGALAGRSDNAVVEAKQIVSPALAYSEGTALAWSFVFLVLLPLAILAAGAFVFIRRRHL